MARFTVLWFAQLRAQTGVAQETCGGKAETPETLYAALAGRHGLAPRKQLALAVAVNEDWADWAQPLADGDTVAFLPPVAGG